VRPEPKEESENDSSASDSEVSSEEEKQLAKVKKPKQKQRKSLTAEPAKKVKADPVSEEDEIPLAKKATKGRVKAEKDVKVKTEEKNVKKERKAKELVAFCTRTERSSWSPSLLELKTKRRR